MPFALSDTSRTLRKPLSSQRVRVNWAHPLNRGLVGWWLINEGQGNKVKDATENKHGTFSGNPTWYTVGNDMSVLMSKVGSDYITVGNSPALKLAGPLSLHLVYYDLNGTRDGYLVGKSQNAWTYGLRITHAGQQISFYLNAYNTGVTFPSTSYAGGLDQFTDRWNTIVGTYDMSQAKIYVNWVNQNSNAFTDPIVTNNDPFAIGTRGDSGANDCDAPISLAAVWNRALSDAEARYLTYCPYGTPSNPRLIYESQMPYFPKQVDVQGTYHRYPVLSY